MSGSQFGGGNICYLEIESMRKDSDLTYLNRQKLANITGVAF